MKNKLLLEMLSTLFQEAIDDGDFEFLENRWLKVQIQDLDIAWMISYRDQQLILAKRMDDFIADACFRGSLNDLVLIAGRKEDPDTLFFQRRLVIEGDTEFGLEVKNLIDSVDLDTLPRVLKTFLSQLSDFVYKGVQFKIQNHKGIEHAHTD